MDERAMEGGSEGEEMRVNSDSSPAFIQILATYVHTVTTQ